MASNFFTNFFYLGTFISSFGSLLFVMCIPSFFINSGHSIESIGIAIGIHRFSGLFAAAWFGPLVDNYNSKKVIFLTEIGAALSSVFLIISWQVRSTMGLALFLIFIGTRAVVIGIQSSSKNRLIKLLSKDNQNVEASMAIWLNKVTQGAHVISSLAAIIVLAKGSLTYAIAIDSISFLIGGASVLVLPDITTVRQKNENGNSNILKSLSTTLKLHKLTFIQDQLLALSVSGTILLMVKLSGNDSTSVIYFNLIFGTCIWLSSFFIHKIFFRNYAIPYWLLMVVGFVLLALCGLNYVRYPVYFVTYMGYWFLYHKFTVEFQINTPKEIIGGVMAARGLALTLTLSLGEVFGGYISRILDLKSELFLRSLICLIAILTLVVTKSKEIRDLAK